MKYINTIKTTLFFGLFGLFGYSQLNNSNNTQIDLKTALPEIIQPSPNVATLMKFEEVPVDYYAGNPNISIPLFSKNMLGFNYNLTLNYNVSGIRVDEIPSWVGTEWSLNEGAVISRSVSGLPDEKLIIENNGGVFNAGGVFHNGYFNINNLSQHDKSRLIWHSSNGSSKCDVNMDIFQFNIFGRTGRFHVIKNNLGQLEAKIVGNDIKLKIALEYDSNFVISKFVVIDENGLKYTFSYIEYTMQSSEFKSITQFGNQRNSTVNSANFSSFNSAWKIQKVETSNGVVLCQFTYTNFNYNYTTPANIQKNKVLPNGDVSFFNNQSNEIGKNYNEGILKPKYTESWNSINIWTPKISKIEFFDSTEINFTTSNHIESGYKLDTFSITNDYGYNESFDFNYQINNVNYNRLFLTNVVDNNVVVELSSNAFIYNSSENATIDDKLDFTKSVFQSLYNDFAYISACM